MHIDFLGPLTQTLNGNSYVGLAVCALTKYVEAAGKIANTKLTFLNIRIPLRFKPTTTPPTRRPPPYGRAATGYLPKEIYADCSHQWMYPVAPVETARCQCHWCRCVGWWARNPTASNVNVSGGESTQLGHGETLTFWKSLFESFCFEFYLH